MQFPRRLARFNRAVTNPIQRTYAWVLPPWVVICHRGRRSGRLYRTPVNGWKRGEELAIVVLYGEASDWVQNVLAGGAQIVRAGRTYDVMDARIVPVEQADGSVAAPARRIGRLSGTLLVVQLSPPRPGFGRGPAAAEVGRQPGAA